MERYNVYFKKDNKQFFFKTVVIALSDDRIHCAFFNCTLVNTTIYVLI